jgi:S-formylglutathione hydrolase FrmB
MEPTSIGLQVVTVVCAVAAVAGAAWGWERGRGRWVWPIRVVTLALCPLTALAAAAVAVNREVDSYSTWDDVFGVKHAANAAPAGAAQPGDTGAGEGGGQGGSQVVQITIVGKRSGMSLPAFVYLPAGYGSVANRQTRYPVVEALAGFPGSPQTWFNGIGALRILDAEIAAGRMAPTVVVFPVQDATPSRDSECVDAVGGAKFDTYLGLDVPDAIQAQFRVHTDRAGWALVGYSTGGFCAANLALRHPDRYTAMASLSGYFNPITDATTGDLYRGDAKARNENDPLWRLRKLPVPMLSVYLAAASDDRYAMTHLHWFVDAAKPPMRITTGLVPKGGHSKAVWSALGPAVFDWLSAQLVAPGPE